jgi:hypothetical protein
LKWYQPSRISVDLSIAFTDGGPSLYVTDLSDDVEGKQDTPYIFFHHRTINDPKVEAHVFN